MANNRVPNWDDVVEIAEGFNTIYKVMLKVSKERTPTVVQKFLNDNDDLIELLLHGYYNVWKLYDQRGHSTAIPRWAANPFSRASSGLPNPFKVWMTTQFSLNQTSNLMDSRRAYQAALKNLEAIEDIGDPKEIQKAFRGVVDVMKHLTSDISKLLNAVYPEQFNYKGFKILNMYRFSRYIVNQMLEGIEALVALFKKRSMLTSLKEGVSTVTLRYASPLDTPGVVGTYNVKTGELTLLNHITKDRNHGHYGDWLIETFIHEFSHHVYYKQLSGESKAFWEGGWDVIYDAKRKDYTKKRGLLLVVSKDDKDHYYDLLKKHKFDYKYVDTLLKDTDQTKYRHWLVTPTSGVFYPDDPSLSFDPNAVVLTPHAKRLRNFLKDNAKAWKEEWKKKREDDPMYSPQYLEEESQRQAERQYSKYMGMLGFGKYHYESYPTIRPEEQVQVQDDLEEDKIREQMGFPTPYAEKNPSEDFAETFVMFLLKPERLSKMARYRIERTLSLSHLYGKPIMQLGEVARKLTLEGHADLALELLTTLQRTPPPEQPPD